MVLATADKTERKRSSSSSPRKKATPKSSPAKTPAIPREEDESKWRKSRLDPGREIGKTDAKDCYYITENELPECVGTRPVNISSRVVTKYLYREIEVERAAWRKHGGPEAFEALLDSKHTKELARPTKKGFKAPEQYWTKYGMSQASNIPPTRPPGFPEWLWTACNNHLDRRIAELEPPECYMLEDMRGDLLRGARAFIQQERYPTRPPRLSDSPSVSNLRAVLRQAPTLIGKTDKEKKAQFFSFPGITHEGEDWIEYYWKKEYLTELFDALIGVLEEQPEEGWKAVRWEVYDRFQECGLGGIHFQESASGKITWSDDASFWLKGYMDASSNRFLDTYLGRRRQHDVVESGRRYNDLLPHHDLTFYL
ncbi:hypothetical protein SISSUDRAFT_1043961 [Sistotremastrum suecicum HHB10207 ss-3]|uniref:Uncharacterized protein n=1 Tax=Sistotremastrum suecicum HHB10207 ss-3 TaxID=1314776 RepID=A0A166FGY1_9AGAM|nr:hypothetical protein SISSUDRAFT_1043961 [Sistotremastrum suecicum HHB10207 ss-3]